MSVTKINEIERATKYYPEFSSFFKNMPSMQKLNKNANEKELLKEEHKYILDVYDSSLEEIFQVKDFYFKLKQRLNGNTWIVFSRFPIYKTIANTFENALFKQIDSKTFIKEFRENLFHLENKTEMYIKEYVNSEEGYNFFKQINNYISRKGIDEVTYLVDLNYFNPERKYEYMTKGKEFLLSTFLSSISVLLGLEELKNKDIFYFYYQPLYLDFNDFNKLITNACLTNLSKDTKLIFDFKHITNNLIEEIQECKIATLINFINEIEEIKKYFHKFEIIINKNNNLINLFSNNIEYCTILDN